MHAVSILLWRFDCFCSILSWFRMHRKKNALVKCLTFDGGGLSFPLPLECWYNVAQLETGLFSRVNWSFLWTTNFQWKLQTCRYFFPSSFAFFCDCQSGKVWFRFLMLSFRSNIFQVDDNRILNIEITKFLFRRKKPVFHELFSKANAILIVSI